MKKYRTAKINFPKFKHILLHSKQNMSKLICSWIWLCFKPQFSLPSAWPCFRPQSSLQMPWPYSRPQLSLHGIGLVSGHLFTKIEKYFFWIYIFKTYTSFRKTYFFHYRYFMFNTFEHIFLHGLKLYILKIFIYLFIYLIFTFFPS